MKKIIDLTISLSSDIPTYPGEPKFANSEVLHVSKDKFTSSLITTPSHLGTHADAPSHFIDGGESITDIPIQNFVGYAFVCDVTPHNGLISNDSFEISLEGMKGEKILIIRTGWDSMIGTPEYFTDFPTFEGRISSILMKKGITTIALDTPSIANLKGTRDMHLDLFKNKITIIESLVNVGEITKQRVFFSGAPVKITGCDGAPVRAYAIEKS